MQAAPRRLWVRPMFRKVAGLLRARPARSGRPGTKWAGNVPLVTSTGNLGEDFDAFLDAWGADRPVVGPYDESPATAALLAAIGALLRLCRPARTRGGAD